MFLIWFIWVKCGIWYPFKQLWDTICTRLILPSSVGLIGNNPFSLFILFFTWFHLAQWKQLAWKVSFFKLILPACIDQTVFLSFYFFIKQSRDNLNNMPSPVWETVRIKKKNRIKVSTGQIPERFRPPGCIRYHSWEDCCPVMNVMNKCWVCRECVMHSKTSTTSHCFVFASKNWTFWKMVLLVGFSVLIFSCQFLMDNDYSFTQREKHCWNVS